MSNPFDDEDAQFYVLVNEEAQHSLWPVFAAIPGGWTIAHGPASRPDCLAYVETQWTDMRPQSLIDAMAEAE
ncbi:MbtH family protein [Nocardia crassostreae]|uniref:MbtH family protein n=1 Tax=Nocardia crassostreae TaxID=53428 RepID=UPI000832A561|nr:MbtH family protein [Nocardia crassostreae]